MKIGNYLIRDCYHDRSDWWWLLFVVNHIMSQSDDFNTNRLITTSRTVKAHLHPVTATCLWCPCDMAPKSNALFLSCTVTPSNSDVAPEWLCNPFEDRLRSNVADASLGVNGPLGLVHTVRFFLIATAICFLLIKNCYIGNWWCCHSHTVWTLPLSPGQPICCEKKNRSRNKK